MDVEQIIVTTWLNVFQATWYIWVLLLIIFIARLAISKGTLGEIVLAASLAKRLPKNQYHILNDVTLDLGEGTTQIDHIVLSRYGIFVIETKTMKGWIYGSAKQKLWTQKIYKKSYRFQNPLHQNYKHIKTIGQLAPIVPSAIKSVVAFLGEAEFKTSIPENVMYGSSCAAYIAGFEDRILKRSELAYINAQIAKYRLEPGRESNRKHVENLKRGRGTR